MFGQGAVNTTLVHSVGTSNSSSSSGPAHVALTCYDPSPFAAKLQPTECAQELQPQPHYPTFSESGQPQAAPWGSLGVANNQLQLHTIHPEGTKHLML